MYLYWTYSMARKILSIDLDGVLNNYQGKYDASDLPEMKDGAFEFLQKLSIQYRITVFTARNKNLVKTWLTKNNLMQFIQDITNKKNPCSSIILDDRAINFDGNFDKAYKNIRNFNPYWKNKSCKDS